MSDHAPQHSDPLQAARREAADWKARAAATQKAAETLKAKAQALKDRTQQALADNKDLSDSLQRARSEVARLQAEAKALSREHADTEAQLAAARQEKSTLQATLATVEQQLALYMRAFEETKQGTDYEQLQRVLRGVMGNPTAEAELQDKLDEANRALEKAAQEKLSLQREVEWYKDQASNLMSELSARDELLEDKEREYYSLYGELDLTKSLIKEMGQATSGHESRLRDQQLEHQKTLELLYQRERELLDKQTELEIVEADTRRMVEEFHREVESLREEIVHLTAEKLELEQKVEEGVEAIKESERMKWIVQLLEDQRSDLEIVNAELYQKLGELEADD